MKQGMSQAVVRHKNQNTHLLPTEMVAMAADAITGRFGIDYKVKVMQSLEQRFIDLCQALNDANDDTNQIKQAIRQIEEVINLKRM